MAPIQNAFPASKKRAAVLFLVLSAAGCSTTAKAPPGSALSTTDLNFLTSAYQLVTFDLSECDVLNSRGGASAQVVQLSAKICADATKYKPILEQVAAANNVTLPNALNYELGSELLQLNSAYETISSEGITFVHNHPLFDVNSQYLTDQIGSHAMALAIFNDEAKNGLSPTLKAFAVQTIPVVGQNLMLLREAQTSTNPT